MRSFSCVFPLTLAMIVGCSDRSGGAVDSGRRDSSVVDASLDGGGDDDSGISDAATDTGLVDTGLVDTGTDDSATTSSKRVFVTTDTYGVMTIASASNADVICQSTADAIGLGGTWMAWLSDSTSSPESRFARSTQAYVLIDGTLIADDWNDLVDGTLAHEINLTEAGEVRNENVATGTTVSGAAHASQCTDWGDTFGTGRNGNSGFTDARWTEIFLGCHRLFSLYCFEQ